DVHHPVDHFAQVDPALAAPRFARRNERGDERPFLVGQVAGIAQMVTLVARAILDGPHRAPRTANQCHTTNHTRGRTFKPLPPLTDSHDSPSRRTDTKGFNRAKERLRAPLALSAATMAPAVM